MNYDVWGSVWAFIVLNAVVDHFRDICDHNYISYPAKTNVIISTTRSENQGHTCRCAILSSNTAAYLQLHMLRMSALYDDDILNIYYGQARVPFELTYDQNFLNDGRNYTLTDYHRGIVEQLSSTPSLRGNSIAFFRVLHGRFQSQS